MRSENYKELSGRIKEAETDGHLERIDTAATRLYDAGQLTEGELSKLYDMIFVKRVKLKI